MAIGGRLTYSAVGRTLAERLLSDPPRGFRPLERSAVVGQGHERFVAAADAVLSWGLQRGSGMIVADAAGLTAKSVTLGQRARLTIPFGPFRVPAPVEVVAVVDDPSERGFVYGTLPGHPESGEEAFLMRLEEDGAVRVVVRAFSRPSSAFWWCGYPMLRLAQELYTRRYLAALRS